MNELIAAFKEYFEIIPASTSELQEEVFRLRYQVYCQEVRLPDFEPWRFPQGLETDEYDARSIHYLLRHRSSGHTAGTVRVILADPDDPGRPFPIELFTARYFDPARIDPAKLPRRHTVEISRLILAKEFRSRRGESSTPYGTSENIRKKDIQGRRHFPHPVLGLLTAVYHVSVSHGITHWYAGMEPTLNRLLAWFDLDLMPIGPVVEYHGLRQPYLGVVDEVLDRAYKHHREVWELLHYGLAA